MQPARLLLKVSLLSMLLHNSCMKATAQDLMWMKGRWKEYSGMPYQIPHVKCVNTLNITAVADSSFAGFQTTCFASDTAIQITYACEGFITKNNARFTRQNVMYKKNSNNKNDEWIECAAYNAHICSLYVQQDKIILFISSTDCDTICNGTVAYYRDLKDFDTLVQSHLASLYNTTQYSNVYASYSLPKALHKTAAAGEQNNMAQADSLRLAGPLPLVLRERTNIVAQTLQITSPNIEVILLDDAEIDGDIVSLYHNNVEVIAHKVLGKEVIKYSFKADKQHTYHELILVAQNLGSIPPNTALMRIRAGDKKYEITTRANMHENAKIIVEYTGE